MSDILTAVHSAIREMNLSHYVDMAAQEVGIAARAHGTFSAVYRPRLFVDGDKWCALYGDNLQDGVAGFGDSPFEAMCDFDGKWAEKLMATMEPSHE